MSQYHFQGYRPPVWLWAGAFPPTREREVLASNTVNLHGQKHKHRKSSLASRSKDLEGLSKKPRGREAVMKATIQAATELFAARGPASVSIRDIAQAARINHALIHRHFGSKRSVLRAVLKQTVDAVAAISGEITPNHLGMTRLFNISAEHAHYWRALARAILDGENPGSIQSEYPTVQRIIELLRAGRRHRPRVSPNKRGEPVVLDERIIAGTIIAVMLGWLLFEPFLLQATGLDRSDREKIRGGVVHVMDALIDLSSRMPATESSADLLHLG